MAPTFSRPQIIEDRYIDEDKLLQVCKQRFAPGTYKLSYKFNMWFLQAPSLLDDVRRFEAP
ncbi:Nn.00g064250.m01.CDS01 [Neocucurbitaria sp. VM-36]